MAPRLSTPEFSLLLLLLLLGLVSSPARAARTPAARVPPIQQGNARTMRRPLWAADREDDDAAADAVDAGDDADEKSAPNYEKLIDEAKQLLKNDKGLLERMSKSDRRVAKDLGLSDDDDDDADKPADSDNSNDDDPVNDLRPKKAVDVSERAGKLMSNATSARDATASLDATLSSIMTEKDKLEALLTKSRQAFQDSLRAAEMEHKAELEELHASIEEERRAFEELYEEKQLISKVLREEQKVLRALQEKIKHPDLANWLRQRASRIALLVETPETDAIRHYARKYMAPKVDKLVHRLENLEQRVERTVNHLLPKQYGSFVAVILSLGLVSFPIVITLYMLVLCSKNMSLRQVVLLGNVFLLAFAFAVCLAGLLLRQDPLKTLYEANEKVFILLQMSIAILFPSFMALLMAAVIVNRDSLDVFVFGCQFLFYLLVGMNYRMRVWRPAMLGDHIETTPITYVVYLMDFVSMTLLTVSAARSDSSHTIALKDLNIGMTFELGSSLSARLSGLLNRFSRRATPANGQVSDADKQA